MGRLKKIVSNLPFAALFFGWSFAISLFANNAGELQLRMLQTPLLAITLFSLFIFILSSMLLKNSIKARVFSSFFIIVFFSYSEVLILLRKAPKIVREAHLGRHEILLPAFIILLILLFITVGRLRSRHLILSKMLTVIGLIAFFLPLTGLLRFEINQKSHPGPKSHQVISQAGKLPDSPPDIYYIVPEDYSSFKIYQEYFGADLSDFTQYLKQKGFYVPDGSTSNYPKSFLSVASSLNMEYLDYLSQYRNSSDQTIVDPLINDNNVMKFLRTLGYKYYQMGSWWEPTHYNPSADDNFILERKSLHRIDEFSYAILNSSMLNPYVAKYLPKLVLGDSEKEKRAMTVYQFEELPEVIKIPGPKFVFVHIIAPHGPYVFDKNCEFIGPKQRRGKSEEENYVNQTKCVNKKLEEAITGILKTSPRSIILLQTDEGAPFLGGRVNPADNWKTADDGLLAEKFPIMDAYYLPGVSKSVLYPSITPVNSFRVIFNLYFSTALELLPDKNYIFSDINHLYEFKDVTDRVIK